MDRRQFLAASATFAGGLLIPIRLDAAAPIARPGPFPERWPVGHFVAVQRDGRVIAQIVKHEMGQGIATAFAAMLAEELNADWQQVDIRFMSHTEAYSFSTGGSNSVRDWWMPVRKAGALAGQLLCRAAAAEWKVPVEEVHTAAHAVQHRDGRRLGFGELADAAARQGFTRDFTQFSAAEIPLKPQADFKLVGTRFRRCNGADIANGSYRYGMDVTPPGALTAVVVRSPTYRGKLRSFDADSVAHIPGIHALVPMRGITREQASFNYVVREGVAIVADSFWTATKARAALKVEWDAGDTPYADSAAFDAACIARLQQEAEAARTTGDWTGFAETTPALDTTFVFPHQTHAAMEPLNASARVDGDSVEVWTGSQSPRLLMIEAERQLGYQFDKIEVHNLPSGGSFGRRYSADIGMEAIQIASAVSPRPVKVIWTREDDLRFSLFHFQSTIRQRLFVDADGNIAAWHMRDLRTGGRELPWNFGYAIPNVRYDFIGDGPADPLPTCAWRSVTGVGWCFAIESAIDALAHQLGRDPLEYRLAHIPTEGEGDIGYAWRVDYARLRRVLETAAERAGWNTPMPAGHARGIACGNYLDKGFCAQVVEITQRDGRPQVTRVVSVVDCGFVVDPDNAEQQVVGNVIWGLTAALLGGVPVNHAVAQWSSFADNRLLTLPQTPRIEVHFVGADADTPPLGLGEIPLPPLIPAVANAWFALTGKRTQRLPIA